MNNYEKMLEETEVVKLSTKEEQEKLKILRDIYSSGILLCRSRIEDYYFSNPNDIVFLISVYQLSSGFLSYLDRKDVFSEKFRKDVKSNRSFFEYIAKTYPPAFKRYASRELQNDISMNKIIKESLLRDQNKNEMRKR